MILNFQTPLKAEVDRPAPDVTFYRSGGLPIKLADLRGKVVVIEFTSLDCPPCRTLAPLLEKFVEDYRKKQVVCMVVSTDPPENLPKLAALRKTGDLTQLVQDLYNRDRSKMGVGQFGNVAVPTMFVIGVNGTFASRQIDDGIPHLKRRVDWALNKAAGRL